MTSPLWRYPGTQCGRIYPQRASPQGSVEDQYYGFVYYTYSYAYDYYSGQVFCLGDDAQASFGRLAHGAGARITQIIDLTGIDLLKFCWRLVTDAAMPQPRVLQTAGPISLVEGELIQFADPDEQHDACEGIVLPPAATSLFAKDESERLIKISGTDHNDGYFHVRSVPWNQGDIQAGPSPSQRLNGQVALLDDMVTPAESPAAATVTLLGARWLARAYVDSTLRVELAERPGRSWQRNELALHVSKLTGDHAVTFQLELDALVETP